MLRIIRIQNALVTYTLRVMREAGIRGLEELTCLQPFLQSQSIYCHAFDEPAAAKHLPAQHQNMKSLPLN